MAPTAQRRRRILVIDDDPASRELIARVAKMRPAIDVIQAQTGAAGLAAAQLDPPTLILLDVQLADLRGDQVLRHLRDHPATEPIPVVIVSADATRATIDAMHAAGATHYLTKPFDVHRLLDLIDLWAAPPHP